MHEIVFMYIGELEAFDATHERWCQSKELFSLSPLFTGIINQNQSVREILYPSYIYTAGETIENTCTATYLYGLQFQFLFGGPNDPEGFSANGTIQAVKFLFACL
jgi:hypothetical protein